MMFEICLLTKNSSQRELIFGLQELVILKL